MLDYLKLFNPLYLFIPAADMQTLLLQKLQISTQPVFPPSSFTSLVGPTAPQEPSVFWTRVQLQAEQLANLSLVYHTDKSITSTSTRGIGTEFVADIYGTEFGDPLTFTSSATTRLIFVLLSEISVGWIAI